MEESRRVEHVSMSVEQLCVRLAALHEARILDRAQCTHAALLHERAQILGAYAQLAVDGIREV